MDDLDNYPLAPFLNALRSVAGRVMLSVLAVILGAYLGAVTATDSWIGGFTGILGFHVIFASSFFFGVGIIALPAAFFFIVMFARSAWPLWTILVVTLLIWWNTHKMVHWSLRESPSAKLEQQLNESFKKAAEQLREERKKRESEQAPIPAKE